MKTIKLRISLTLALFALILSPFVQSGEQKTIPLEQVPSEHRENAQNLLPKAKFTTANTETEFDGITIYEIQGRPPDGRRVEVDLFENGKLEEYEIEFTKTQVPGAVLIGIQKKLPGFKPTYIEASHSASGKVMRYEFEGTLGDQKIDIEVSADGRKINVGDK